MKKLCLLLALVLCLAVAAQALASDWTFTELGVFEDAEFVSDSNLLCVRTNDGYRVCRVNGESVTADAYGSRPEGAFGYVIASRVNGGLNAAGVFDELGNVLVPYQYGDIEFLSRDWVVGFKLKEATAEQYDYSSWSSDAYFLIDTVDVYNLAKGTTPVATLTRSQYKDAAVVGNVLNIEDRSTGAVTSYDADFNALGTVDYTFSDDYATYDLTAYRDNGRYGLKDAAGNVVMEPSYYSINDFYGDYATVYTGEKYGLIDRTGKLIVPTMYDSIRRDYYGPYDPATGEESYNAAGYFAVVSDDKLGFVNEQGVETCPPKYAESIMDVYGAVAKYTDMENQIHLLAADGVDTVVTGYESIYCLDYSSGMLLKVNDANYNSGLIDWHGNVVFDCAYSDFELSGDGRYLLVSVSYDEYRLYEVGYPTGAAVAAPAAPEAQAAPEAPKSEGAPAAETQSVEDARAVINNLLGRGGEKAQAPETKVEPEAPVAEAPAPEVAAPEAPAVEAPAAEAPATNSGLTDAKAVLGAVVTLLESDAAANKTAILLLMDDLAVLTADNASAGTIITSARTLIDTDAAANASAAVTLLRSVETLL